VKEVFGSWKVPTLNCASTPSAVLAFWVGIDGWTSGTVEKVGFVGECSSGVASYYAFYQLFPQDPNFVQFSPATYPVKAGDIVTGQVNLPSVTSQFLFTIGDTKAGWSTDASSYSLCGGNPCNTQDNSVEWIAEAYSICSVSCVQQPLANFGTLSSGRIFTHVFGSDNARIGGTHGAISLFKGKPGDTVYRVNMNNCVTTCGTTATTSGLKLSTGGSGGSSSFSITWVSS
jgi:hypothetical protein